MFTFIIISNADQVSVSVYQAFATLGIPEEEEGGRIIVESQNGMKDGWIAFQPIKDIQYDYEIEELEEINKIISTPSFYLIEGRNGVVNFSNRFIQEFNPSGKVMIDNDHGLIGDLSHIKEKINTGEDWLYLPS